jgi:DNA adenine methylase
MKVFVPPIKCQGIKTKLIPWIHELVSLSSETLWIEPFMGSGVVGFNMRPKRAIFADTNPHIIAFYNAVKTREITLGLARGFLEHHGAVLAQRGDEYYYEVRKRFNQSHNPLDFLFLSRSGFNGVMRFNRKGAYNVPFGHKPERFAKAYITKIVNQIDYVAKACEHYEWTFICQDFRVSCSEGTEDAMIYCDPPYSGRHTDYFDSWSETDEHDLFVTLLSTPASFLLSTWERTEWRTNTALQKYAEHFTVLTRKHFYHVGANEDNRKSVIEALVGNNLQVPQTSLYQPSEQLHLLEMR